MVTRFVPVGYQPEHGRESTAEKVHRAVDGPRRPDGRLRVPLPAGALRATTSTRSATRSTTTGSTAWPRGLHLDPRFGRGGLSSPDDAIRDEALRVTARGREFAGEIGAHFIIWPGIEGYNYPFQTPYAESWARV